LRLLADLGRGPHDHDSWTSRPSLLFDVQIEVFPASVIAKTFNFGGKPLLEFAAAEKADVDMKQLFS
jgi:LemA protein